MKTDVKWVVGFISLIVIFSYNGGGEGGGVPTGITLRMLARGRVEFGERFTFKVSVER